MRTIYEDDIYPGKTKRYQGLTIGEILETHPDPKQFITQFNRSNDYCLSDEVSVNRKKHSFPRPMVNWSYSQINDFT